MRLFHRTVLILFFLVVACGGEKNKIPLSEEELVNFLIDIHLAEAAVQDLYGATKDSVGRAYYEQIYQVYDIDKNIYDTTLAVLRRNPVYAGKVYQKVMQAIDERQSGVSE